MTDNEKRELIGKHLDIPLDQFFGANRGSPISRENLVGLKWFLTGEMMNMFEVWAIEEQAEKKAREARLSINIAKEEVK